MHLEKGYILHIKFVWIKLIFIYSMKKGYQTSQINVRRLI